MLKKEFEIEDEWLPMEIHTETPKTGIPLTELFDASAVEKMHMNLRRTGEEYGIIFDASSRLSNSHIALATGEYSKEVGKFHEYHEKIFSAYFTHGKDIGDSAVILEIAEELKMDVEELNNRLQQGHYDGRLAEVLAKAEEYGVNSTPTFIVNDKYAIIGAQPLKVFRNLLNNIEK